MRERREGLVIQIASISGKRASVLGGGGYSAHPSSARPRSPDLPRPGRRPRGIRSTVIYLARSIPRFSTVVPCPSCQERKTPSSNRRTLPQPSLPGGAQHLSAHVPELVITTSRGRLLLSDRPRRDSPIYRSPMWRVTRGFGPSRWRSHVDRQGRQILPIKDRTDFNT